MTRLFIISFIVACCEIAFIYNSKKASSRASFELFSGEQDGTMTSLFHKSFHQCSLDDDCKFVARNKKTNAYHKFNHQVSLPKDLKKYVIFKKERDVDECQSNPCLNGGTCIDGVNQYTCQCFDGYKGTNCAEKIVGCDSYATLSEADRAHSYVGGYPKCDYHLATQWYRFSGAAGNRMRSSCVSDNVCGTYVGGWLNGAHPSIAEGEVSRTVCFANGGNCCKWFQTIKVKNCGGFYIYYLSKPNVGCDLRYCGSG